MLFPVGKSGEGVENAAVANRSKNPKNPKKMKRYFGFCSTSVTDDPQDACRGRRREGDSHPIDSQPIYCMERSWDGMYLWRIMVPR